MSGGGALSARAGAGAGGGAPISAPPSRRRTSLIRADERSDRLSVRSPASLRAPRAVRISLRTRPSPLPRALPYHRWQPNRAR
ncbi:hypothetical protein EVAR_47434_1 [Eumeta japonica]|uniref:Uncharacterized protein n=1 Tax=Eumeta variegata TaxID=151549 RepID=A0A4C1Y3N2_EUMVA|nr:hypothetical protein EVAR_47434_1 [Eumeta japonica]